MLKMPCTYRDGYKITMTHWGVVHTQPLKEGVAKQHLHEQGFEVYLPLFRKTRRHARKTEEVLAPLFPRYLFVNIDLDHAPFRSINGTRGVAYLIMSKNKPLFVPTHIIDNLRQQTDQQGTIPIESLHTFLQGDCVRITEGAFQDHTATFVTLTDQQRVQILLHFMGQDVPLTLPLHAIENI